MSTSKYDRRQAIPFNVHCQLCLPLRAAAGRPPADDTRHHLLNHKCEAPAVVTAREALRADLCNKMRKMSLNTMGPQQAAETAGLLMRRDDYYAGQIDSAARDRIEEAMRTSGGSSAGGAPTATGAGGERGLTPAPNGSLQRAVPKHSLLIHTIREEAVPISACSWHE